MKLAFFFGNAGNPGPHGSGTERYELELARAMAEINTTDELHYIFLYANGPKAVGVKQPNISQHVLWPSIRPASMLVSLPALVARYRPEVLHSTFIPPVYGAGTQVYTLPCSSPFLFPEMFDPAVGRRMRFLFQRGIDTSRAIVCYSKSLQDWTHERTGIARERLPVVPMAASDAFHPMPKEEVQALVRERYGISAPYFVFSGRLEARKNIFRIIEAFAQFKKSVSSDMKLVLCGSRFWGAEKADQLIAKLGIEDEVVRLSTSRFEELPALYAGARALTFPSLWETFGLPVVEAMSCGTAVLTSKTSCLPEVAGGAAHLVDPESVEEIATGMDRIASDDEYHARLCAASIERAKAFSWRHTAELSMQVYRAAVK
ncbi:MAG: glycosyltransferase family 1 protein [Acidobacteria bacterium]|nr:glycosyltransferase family 1 protein [Acidobacteriota bacterium]